MKSIFSALVVTAAVGFAMPAFAADKAACLADWSKMDTTNAGFISGEAAQRHVAMMKKAGKTTAAADRMTSQEYMEACQASIFQQK